MRPRASASCRDLHAIALRIEHDAFVVTVAGPARRAREFHAVRRDARGEGIDTGLAADRDRDVREAEPLGPGTFGHVDAPHDLEARAGREFEEAGFETLALVAVQVADTR